MVDALAGFREPAVITAEARLERKFLSGEIHIGDVRARLMQAGGEQVHEKLREPVFARVAAHEQNFHRAIFGKGFKRLPYQ